MTVGLFALALWLVVQAVLGIGPGDVKRWLRALTSATKAAAYIALGLTALAFARGSSSHASTSTRRASSNVLDLPGG
jgi:membrane protein required for beta-lactamase induction